MLTQLRYHGFRIKERRAIIRSQVAVTSISPTYNAHNADDFHDQCDYSDHSSDHDTRNGSRRQGCI